MTGNFLFILRTLILPNVVKINGDPGGLVQPFLYELNVHKFYLSSYVEHLDQHFEYCTSVIRCYFNITIATSDLRSLVELLNA